MNKKIWLLFAIIAIIAVLIMILIPKNNNKQENVNYIQNNISNEKQINNTDTNNTEKKEVVQVDTIQIRVNDKVLKVQLENNSSADAFVEKLKDGDIIINTHDYGNFEKVGDLGFNLPTNDTKITTGAGDLILYQGNQITLYYDTNTWTITKLGKVEDISKQELKDILGEGDVSLTFSLD